MVHGGEEDAFHLALEQQVDRERLNVGVAAGVAGEQQQAVLPGGFLGAAQDVAGKGRGANLVGDETDEAGFLCAHVARDEVGAVIEVLNGAQHLLAEGIADVAVVVDDA